MADDHEATFKGKRFLEKVNEYANSDAARAGRMVVKEIQIDIRMSSQLVKVASDPKRAGIIITAAVIQKAMAAANLQTRDETKACLAAVANLASDFAVAAALGPTTLGLGALLPLVLAAVDAYDVGQSCFNVDGGVTHAVTQKVRSDAKAGLRTTRHGPI